MTAPVTAVLSIDFDPDLVSEVAWSGLLRDENGYAIAQLEGPSAYDICTAAATEVDRFVARQLAPRGTAAPTPEGVPS